MFLLQGCNVGVLGSLQGSQDFDVVSKGVCRCFRAAGRDFVGHIVHNWPTGCHSRYPGHQAALAFNRITASHFLCFYQD